MLCRSVSALCLVAVLGGWSAGQSMPRPQSPRRFPAVRNDAEAMHVLDGFVQAMVERVDSCEQALANLKDKKAAQAGSVENAEARRDLEWQRLRLSRRLTRVRRELEKYVRQRQEIAEQLTR